MKQYRLALCVFCALVMSACASYTSKTREGLSAFERRDFVAAEKSYKEGAEEDGVDQLLYLFDRATVRHLAGNYAASSKDFLLADQISEIKDYTNLATEVATIVTNDRIIPYKGEEFETVLISTYLALNFALEGKDEDAIVECKRVNRKLERLRSEGKRNYDLNAFAQYLSGVLYERSKNWNSAYVDYRKTYDLAPYFSPLRSDLMKGALSLDSESEKDRWKRKFQIGDVDFRPARKELKEDGAVVLILQNGSAPEKVQSSVWPELPEYIKRYNRHQSANLYIDGKKVANTEMLYDVEKVAFENLKSKYALYLVKRAAGLVAREVIGNQVAKQTKSDALGALSKLAMFAASQPDLRSWLTLPKNFQVARVALAPGKYQASLRMVNGAGTEEAEKSLGTVVIKNPGDIALLNYRSLND